MDQMIKKWKKLINNEKSTSQIKDENQENYKEYSNSNSKNNSRSKSKDKNKNKTNENIEDLNCKNKKFNTSQISNFSEKPKKNIFKNSISSNINNNNTFNLSELENHNNNNHGHIKNSTKKTFAKNLNLSNLSNNLSNSKSKEKNNKDIKDNKENNKKNLSNSFSLSPLRKENINNINNNLIEDAGNDELLKKLYKLLNILPKSNLDNFDINNFSDDLNEIINLYIKKINNIKEIKNNFEQKEIILQTKCNTAERILKEYEIKYLTAEKEKVNNKFYLKIKYLNI